MVTNQIKILKIIKNRILNISQKDNNQKINLNFNCKTKDKMGIRLKLKKKIILLKQININN